MEHLCLIGQKCSAPFNGTDTVSLQHSGYVEESVTVLTLNTFIGRHIRCHVLDRRQQKTHALIVRCIWHCRELVINCSPYTALQRAVKYSLESCAVEQSILQYLKRNDCYDSCIEA